MIYCSFY